jgi:hypothetical protein
MAISALLSGLGSRLDPWQGYATDKRISGHPGRKSGPGDSENHPSCGFFFLDRINSYGKPAPKPSQVTIGPKSYRSIDFFERPADRAHSVIRVTTFAIHRWRADYETLTKPA